MPPLQSRSESAHPLFPPDQVFLWLPGFEGEERAYCSYNEIPSQTESVQSRNNPQKDDQGTIFAPPYPVSYETNISWHTDVSPPYPYHPVPIARSLSSAEMTVLARQVTDLLDDPAEKTDDPLSILRNSRKCYILAALARFGLLPGPVPTLSAQAPYLAAS